MFNISLSHNILKSNSKSIRLLWNSHIGMQNPDFKNITIYRLNRKTFIIINHFSNLTQKEFRRFH